MADVRSTCCFCGVGCGVLIEAGDGAITGVRGDPEHPANRGNLCSKGRALHLTTGIAGRALYPEVRCARSRPRMRIDWDAALEYLADRYAETIAQHGPDAVGFYVSGQLLTEDYFAFNKLARALVEAGHETTLFVRSPQKVARVFGADLAARFGRSAGL